jgi:hypothetical protein
MHAFLQKFEAVSDVREKWYKKSEPLYLHSEFGYVPSAGVEPARFPTGV